MRPLVTVTLLALASSCVQEQDPASPPDGAGTFVWSVDATLAPEPATIDAGPLGPRPLAAVVDAQGRKATFVADEVIVSPASETALRDFLQRTGGTVIARNEVPAPPAGAGIEMDPAFAQATQVLVKVDPARLDASRLAAEASRASFEGTFRLSNDTGAGLLALVAAELAAGRGVAANFVGTHHAPGETVLLRTAEAGGQDAFLWTDYGAFGARTNVARAWQFVRARGVPRRPKIAIIDNGFLVDQSGMSLTPDMPAQPLQRDFVDGDGVVAGMNPPVCGGGPCPWHGAGSAAAALARVGDGAGAAGPGGAIADPILFRAGLDLFQIQWAVRASIAWGAEVVSTSFGICGLNLFCRAAFETTGFADAFRDAHQAGVVMVSSAGNAGDQNAFAPCGLDGVICVGGLAANSNVAFASSNFGSWVDLWAPWAVPAVYSGNPNGPFNLTNFTGTSASAPFVAGIAAMLKAYDATLTSSEVKAILQQTAHKDSPDPKVTAYVDAFAAVIEVAGSWLPDDALEPNDVAGQAAQVVPGDLYDLTIARGADVDTWRVDTGGYTRVFVGASYTSGIGTLGYGGGWAKASGCGVPVQLLASSAKDAWTYAVDLPPGSSSLLTLAGTGRLAYNLQFQRLDVPVQPDPYEANDGVASATYVSQGGYTATLHAAADVDHYRFYANGSTGKPFVFNVLSADAPVTVTILDADGVEVASATTPPDCSGWPAFTLPAGGAYYTARVQAPTGALTSYRFGLGLLSLPPPPLITILGSLNLWWLQPGDPGIRLLLGVREGFTFEPNVDTSSVLLTGAGLHLVLYDLSGNKLAEGVATGDPERGTAGERLSLAGLSQAQVALSVERVEPAAAGGAPPPALRYELGLGVNGQ